MNDSECVRFLQWALPRLQLRWPGFRRVRGQVCKRLQRRIDEIQLDELPAYRAYLDEHHNEWTVLDGLCQVTISRFYRDKAAFAFLEEQVIPYLISNIDQALDPQLRIWCAGCGAGEEPYTLAILWALRFQDSYPSFRLPIMATDINPDMLERAKQACYPYSAIKNLPTTWQEAAFRQNNEPYCLQAEYQANVEFLCQDLRSASSPDSEQKPFHLVCCRNLAFTYFDDPLQCEVVKRLHSYLVEGGVLMIGIHEELPTGIEGFKTLSKRLGIYQRVP